jgi:hypothetical protein
MPIGESESAARVDEAEVRGIFVAGESMRQGEKKLSVRQQIPIVSSKRYLSIKLWDIFVRLSVLNESNDSRVLWLCTWKLAACNPQSTIHTGVAEMENGGKWKIHDNSKIAIEISIVDNIPPPQQP